MASIDIIQDLMHLTCYCSFFEEDLALAVRKSIETNTEFVKKRTEGVDLAATPDAQSPRFTIEEKAAGWDYTKACLEILGKEMMAVEDSLQLPITYPSLSAASLKTTSLCQNRQDEDGEDLDSISQRMSSSFVQASQLWKDIYGDANGEPRFFSPEKIATFILQSKSIEMGMMDYARDDNCEDEYDESAFERLLDYVSSLIQSIMAADDRQVVLSSIFSLGGQDANNLALICGLIFCLTEACHLVVDGKKIPAKAKEVVLVIDNLTDPTARNHLCRLREWAHDMLKAQLSDDIETEAATTGNQGDKVGSEQE